MSHTGSLSPRLRAAAHPFGQCKCSTASADDFVECRLQTLSLQTMGILCWVVVGSCIGALLTLSLTTMEKCASTGVVFCCSFCTMGVTLIVYTVFTIIVRAPDTIAWLLQAC